MRGSLHRTAPKTHNILIPAVNDTTTLRGDATMTDVPAPTPISGLSGSTSPKPTSTTWPTGWREPAGRTRSKGRVGTTAPAWATSRS